MLCTSVPLVPFTVIADDDQRIGGKQRDIDRNFDDDWRLLFNRDLRHERASLWCNGGVQSYEQRGERQYDADNRFHRRRGRGQLLVQHYGNEREPATEHTAYISPTSLTVTHGGANKTATVTLTVDRHSRLLPRSAERHRGVESPCGHEWVSLSNSGNVTVTAGGSNGSSTITLTARAGLTGSTSLTASGLPTNATASFNPASITASGSSTLTFVTPASVAGGTYTITVTGTNGTLTRTTTLTLTVKNFSLSMLEHRLSGRNASGRRKGPNIRIIT